MGFRASWMATQASESEVLSALNATRSGASGEYFDFKMSMGRLGTGWTVVWSENEDFFDDPRSAKLSSSFPLIACWVNETIMHSKVRQLSDGQEKWAIWHEGDEDQTHFASSGAPPAELPNLIGTAREQQAADEEVDYLFDVPLIIAENICGFKHDQFMDDSVSFNEILVEDIGRPSASTTAQKSGWLSRLFGRNG